MTVEWREVEKLRNGIRYRKFVDDKPTNGYMLILGADPSIDEQVGASTDDGVMYKNVGVWEYFNITSSTQPAGRSSSIFSHYGGGMRFQTVPVPHEANIIAAKLILRASEDGGGTVCRTKIRGQDSGDTLTFTTSQVAYFARPRTSAYVTWEVPAWIADTDYESPDIKDVIQEIVDHPDWESDNNLVIFWDDHGDLSDDGALRRAYSYNGSTTYAPKLHIEYTAVAAVVGPFPTHFVIR